jgi:hypothetical protein
VKKLLLHTEEIIEHEISQFRGKRDVDPDRPKERVAITDQKALLNVDPMRVLTGEVEIFDDRAER